LIVFVISDNLKPCQVICKVATVGDYYNTENKHQQNKYKEKIKKEYVSLVCELLKNICMDTGYTHNQNGRPWRTWACSVL